MRSHNIIIAQALTVTALIIPGAAAAQDYPAPTPLLSYNAARAHRHFLNSRYSYRTYSGLYPGYSVSGFTPYGYEVYSQSPAYYHERISPRGIERYHVNPTAERVVVPYPPRVYLAPAVPEYLVPPP